MALPQSWGRVDAFCDFALAWRAGGGDLSVYLSPACIATTAAFFWDVGEMVAVVFAIVESSAGQSLTGGAASGVSGGGFGIRICETQLRAMPVALDRIARANGARESIFRKSGIRQGGPFKSHHEIEKRAFCLVGHTARGGGEAEASFCRDLP